MRHYRLTANIEWTSKCNAKCAMCPRHVIDRPKLMSPEVFQQTMARLSTRDLCRAIIAGYGEPTTHPRFMEYVEALRGHPVRFDMVSNGQQLDDGRLRHLDGALGMLMLSFSSVDSDVYSRVHANLDQDRVMHNIAQAARVLDKTHLSVSLTPMPECLDTLPRTIEWLHANGVHDLRMSPNFYNRAGSQEEMEQTRTLREIIRRYDLKALDLDFVPGILDVLVQLRRNRFRCIPRNTSMFITSHGDYLYCYNDMSHRNVLGNVTDLGLRDAVRRRERSTEKSELCATCNMRGRYQGRELWQTALGHLRNRLAPPALART